eukprot:6183489-Prymnesium_polylepis.1
MSFCSARLSLVPLLISQDCEHSVKLQCNCVHNCNKLLPVNPWERTGLTGRGLLGKIGPTHAADPIFVRLNMSRNTLPPLYVDPSS